MAQSFGFGVEGSVQEAANQIKLGLLKAANGAMRDEVAAAKGRLRGDVVAGLRNGAKLAKTWQANTYPRSGLANDPAGFIFNKAPEIIDAFSLGVTIVGKGGKWLAIPAPAVRARIVKAMKRTLSGQFAKIEDWPNVIATALGAPKPLFFVEPGGERGFIYIKRDKDRLIIGWLEKQSVLGKRFEGRVLLDQIENALPASYDARFTEYLGAELADL